MCLRVPLDATVATRTGDAIGAIKEPEDRTRPLDDMADLKLPDFDESKDKWKPYRIKVEAYFEANAVANSAKKRALLVAALSTHTVQTLAGKVAPRTPNSLTYEEAVATLNEYYDPKGNEIFESYKFVNRGQAEG